MDLYDKTDVGSLDAKRSKYTEDEDEETVSMDDDEDKMVSKAVKFVWFHMMRFSQMKIHSLYLISLLI